MKDSQDPSSKDFAFQAVFRLTLQMFTEQPEWLHIG